MASSSSSLSLGLSSTDSGKQRGMQGFNTVGEDTPTMFSEYKGPLPIHPRGYELPLGICRSGSLSQAETRGEEHDARDAVRLYRETMREGMLEFGDPSTVELKLTKHELKIAERAAAVQAGDVAKVAHIDACEEDRRKWKAYHRNIRKARAKASKANKGS